MANKKISELTDAGTITTSDEIPLARAGRTYKAKIGLSIVPTGCVMAFAGTAIPEGWLKCNGEAIPNGQGTVQGKTANFSVLYSVIGANVPDLRGLFIRGLDDGRGADAGRQIGTYQNDAFKNHSHPYVDTYANFGSKTKVGGNNETGWNWVTPYTYNNSTTSGSGEGGTETRPKNLALHYIIKY
jgi:phage-related tail fiber protein